MVGLYNKMQTTEWSWILIIKCFLKEIDNVIVDSYENHWAIQKMESLRQY